MIMVVHNKAARLFSFHSKNSFNEKSYLIQILGKSIIYFISDLIKETKAN